MTVAARPRLHTRRDAAAGPRRLAPAVGVVAALGLVVLALVLLTLSCGRTCHAPQDVIAALTGAPEAEAAFVVMDLRLPRALLGLGAGLCLGLGGVAFQVMLRNPLASPDIIGISSGAGAAAVFAIVILSLEGLAISVAAIAAGLAVAVTIWGLSAQRGGAGARLILVGIGVSAMLDSVTAYLLLEAPAWDRAEALRWLTGSLNGARLAEAGPVYVALTLCGAVLAVSSRDLDVLRLGDDTARALGVGADRTRLLVTVAAVGLVAVTTAATGPIAFVAFLAGPIAARLLRGARGLLPAAALVGAALVLAGDFAGQYLLPARLPVGVVTGAIGAPFLLSLIVRANRKGGAL